MKNSDFSFHITDGAKNRIKELQKNSSEKVFVRVSVVNGGCGGNQYLILLDDLVLPTDFIIKESNIILLAIEQSNFSLLNNAEIDFENSLEFSGFKINNPNALGVCNCGNSFSCSSCEVVKKDDCSN